MKFDISSSLDFKKNLKELQEVVTHNYYLLKSFSLDLFGMISVIRELQES